MSKRISSSGTTGGGSGGGGGGGGTSSSSSSSSMSAVTIGGVTSSRVPPRTSTSSGITAAQSISIDLNSRPTIGSSVVSAAMAAIRPNSVNASNEVPPSTRQLLSSGGGGGIELGGGSGGGGHQSAQSLIDLKSEASYFHRIKKRPISGVLNSDADSELTCPICFDLIDIAHVTKCGHSFCQSCIQTALDHTHRCPKCNTPCQINKDVFPNFTLNQIIEKYRDETNHKKCKFAQRPTTSGLLELLNSSQDDLNIDDVNQLIQILAARKEELKFTHKKVTELLVYDFLKHLQQTKTEELNRIQYELQIVNEDCRLVEECLNSLQVESPHMSAAAASGVGGGASALKRRISSSNQLIKVEPPQSMINNTTASEQDQQVRQDSDTIIITSEDIGKDLALITSTNQQTTTTTTTTTSGAISSPTEAKVQSVLNGKKRILHRYFDELSQTYINSAHNRDFKDLGGGEGASAGKATLSSPSPSLPINTSSTHQSQTVGATCSGTGRSSGSVLNKIRDTVSRMTTYSQFKSLASVNYNSDMYGSSSIVSSVDFDQSYERFAMAGVTKRIKIFDFQNILDRPHGVHYPLLEMSHNAKLSCVNWNRYFRQQLACSDYDGVVTLWDADTGHLLKSYQEHEKRCWGVQFCDVDPRLLASGSDDSRVKIWSTASDYSVMSIDAKSNVCCVAFKPDSKFHLLFGTADHNIHYYDLRNCKEPVSLFKGHKKAVSYVKFNGENEFVSASTDSSLKLWRINEGQCVRSFTGHLNEKNFVGLEAKNGYVVTGSENNTVYLYCTDLAKPLQTYKFEETSSGSSSNSAAATAATNASSTTSVQSNKRDESSTNNDFVSAVCWSNQNHLLAANSQGVVRVLELV